MANIWKQFKELLPKEPLRVGVVDAIGPTEAAIILPDGARILARGIGYTLGQRVYVRGGVIEGSAPDVGAEVEIEV